MRRFLMTIVLTCVVSTSAFAGLIPTVPGPQPPPPESASTTSPGDVPTVPGDVSTSGVAEQLSSAAQSALLMVFGLL